MKDLRRLGQNRETIRDYAITDVGGILVELFVGRITIYGDWDHLGPPVSAIKLLCKSQRSNQQIHCYWVYEAESFIPAE
jgi:hypothetical protein